MAPNVRSQHPSPSVIPSAVASASEASKGYGVEGPCVLVPGKNASGIPPPTEKWSYSNCMLRLRLCDLGLIALVAILSTPRAWAQPKPRLEQFPLAKGSYWIYEGEETSQRPGQGAKVFTEKITWRMEVVDRTERNGIVAAVVRGYPDGEPQELQVLVAVDGRDFYLLPADPSVLKRVKDPNDALVDLVEEDQIILSLPLAMGKRFCEAEQITRPDGYYCWVVEDHRKDKLTSIRGVASDINREVYRIAFRTLPDHVILGFAPGVGITSWVYVHHGTIMEERVKLVEFHNGAALAH